MNSKLNKLPPKLQPPLAYANGDPRGVQMVAVSGSREYRRKIEQSGAKLEISSWKQTAQDGNTYLVAKLVVKGTQVAADIQSGYYLGEWVGEKQVSKIEFERLADKKKLLGSSKPVFGFLYTFTGLAEAANEISSTGTN